MNFVPIQEFIEQRSNAGTRRWKSSSTKFTKLLPKQKMFREKLGSCKKLKKTDKNTWTNEVWSIKILKNSFEFKINPELSLKKAWDAWRDYLKILEINPTMELTK